MRRRLRGTLRRAREAAGLTQRATAERLFWSLSKVIRIEQGTVAVRPTDVQVMMQLFGVQDPEMVQSLMELAHSARGSDTIGYRADYGPETLTLFGNEGSASVMYFYESSVVPGILQTEEYAAALLQSLEFSEAETTDRVADRMDRQRLLSGPDRPNLHVVLGEAVLSRLVGGNSITMRQISRLQRLAAEPGITIQILLFTAGAYRGMDVPFRILQFDDVELPDLLFLEDGFQGYTSNDTPHMVAQFQERFVKLQGMATSPEDFAVVADEIAAIRFPQG